VRLLCAPHRSSADVLRLCDSGWLFVAKEVGADGGEPPLGAAIVVPGSQSTFELAAFAVEQTSGWPAGELLAAVVDALRAVGARTLVVGAGAIDEQQSELTLEL
jgi:hypothetical protein